MNVLQFGNLYYMEYGPEHFVLFVAAHAMPIEDQRDDESYMSFILYDHTEAFRADDECPYVHLPSAVRARIIEDLVDNREIDLTHTNFSEELNPEDYMNFDEHEVTYEYFFLNKRNENFMNPPVRIRTNAQYQRILHRIHTTYGLREKYIERLKDFTVLLDTDFLPSSKPQLSL